MSSPGASRNRWWSDLLILGAFVAVITLVVVGILPLEEAVAWTIAVLAVGAVVLFFAGGIFVALFFPTATALKHFGFGYGANRIAAVICGVAAIAGFVALLASNGYGVGSGLAAAGGLASLAAIGGWAFFGAPRSS